MVEPKDDNPAVSGKITGTLTQVYDLPISGTLAGMRFRSSRLFLVFCLTPLVWGTEDGTPAAVAQKMFGAMQAHDATTASALFLPGASLAATDAGGKVSVMSSEKFVERLGTSKDAWLERMWNAKVLEQGSIAVVWAEYDFYLNGKFSHCGIDSFSLLKVDGAWRIAGVSYTRETTGCAPSPLGPPKTQ